MVTNQIFLYMNIDWKIAEGQVAWSRFYFKVQPQLPEQYREVKFNHRPEDSRFDYFESLSRKYARATQEQARKKHEYTY